jgi:hypothetical protein
MEASASPVRPAPPPFESPSLVRPGALIAIAGAVGAGVLAVIAVVDTSIGASGAGVGAGVLFAAILPTATVACGLACLSRRTFELVALVAVAVSVVALDLIALALAADITSTGYGRATGTFVIWAVFLLLILGLFLAAPTHGVTSQALSGITVAALLIAAIDATWLIFSDTTGNGPAELPFGPSFDPEGTSLTILGVALAIGACGWLASLAASRLDRG